LAVARPFQGRESGAETPLSKETLWFTWMTISGSSRKRFANS